MSSKPRPTTARPVSRNRGVDPNATTTRKRPFPEPMATNGIKRSRNKGPFFDGSESDSSEADHQKNPEKPTPKFPLATDQNNRLSLSSLRAKALNSSRLRSLLNKNQKGSTPHIHTQPEGVTREPKVPYSTNRFQQKPATTGPAQQTSPKTPILSGGTPSRSEHAKPKSAIRKSLNVSAGSGHQIRGPTKLKQAQAHNYHPDPIIKTESQRSNSFQDTARLAHREDKSDRRILKTPREYTNTTKTENESLTPALIPAATNVDKKNIMLAVNHHNLDTVPNRPLQEPGKKLAAHPKAVKSFDMPKGSQSSITMDETFVVRRPSIVQSRESLNIKPSAKVPQPLAGTQVLIQMKGGEYEGATGDKGNPPLQAPARPGVQAGAGASQKLHKQDSAKEIASQKALSKTLTRPSVRPVRGQGYDENKFFPQQNASTTTVLTPSKFQSNSFSTIPNHESYVLSPLPPPSSNGSSLMAAVQTQAQDVSARSNETNNYALLITSNPLEKAEPYFEYSVFQKIWGSGQLESETAATEITSQPFTNIHHANAHTEKHFKNVREHYMGQFQYQLVETTSKRDMYDCETHTGAFASVENPDKIFHVRFWVQRDSVSVFANQEPASMKLTPFIMKSVFVLRLFKLASNPHEASSEGTDNNVAQIRLYHPIQRTQVYTTLEAANRAARIVQIELSHDAKSADEASAKTRQLYIRELNTKLHVLDGLAGEDDGYWKSQFRGFGQPADQYELVVERVGLCGPRNL